MAQTSRISSNNTVILNYNDEQNGENVRSVILHRTEIVRVIGNKVRFNTGGFFTKTTQRRMMQVCNEWNLPFTLGFHKGKEYVADRAGNVIKFFAGSPAVEVEM